MAPPNFVVQIKLPLLYSRTCKRAREQLANPALAGKLVRNRQPHARIRFWEAKKQGFPDLATYHFGH